MKTPKKKTFKDQFCRAITAATIFMLIIQGAAQYRYATKQSELAATVVFAEMQLHLQQAQLQEAARIIQQLQSKNSQRESLSLR